LWLSMYAGLDGLDTSKRTTQSLMAVGCGWWCMQGLMAVDCDCLCMQVLMAMDCGWWCMQVLMAVDCGCRCMQVLMALIHQKGPLSPWWQWVVVDDVCRSWWQWSGNCAGFSWEQWSDVFVHGHCTCICTSHQHHYVTWLQCLNCHSVIRMHRSRH